jgi:hypothetical protein
MSCYKEDEHYVIREFSPEDGATGASVFQKLEYDCQVDFSGNIRNRKIYADTIDPPALLNTEYDGYIGSEGTYSLKFLENNTEYFWEIKVLDHKEDFVRRYYKTGVHSFKTMGKDGIEPQIDVISPAPNEECYDIMNLIAEFDDENDIGFIRVIHNDVTELFSEFYCNSLNFDWDILDQKSGIHELKYQVWDHSGEYSETIREVNILDQICLWNYIGDNVQFSIENEHDFFMDLNDRKTIAFNSFTEEKTYTLRVNSSVYNGLTLGDDLVISDEINENDLCKDYILEPPVNYRRLTIVDRTESYNYFTITGISESNTTKYYYEFDINCCPKEDDSYFVGFFNIDNLCEFKVTASIDSTSAIERTYRLTDEEIGQNRRGISIYISDWD